MKKGLKNIIASLLSQIITIGLGVIIPRLILVNLGSESNGLLSSIGSVLSYLALLESGVGLATQQALYQPIALDDKKSINAIMSATNYYYQRIGKWYGAIVVVIAVIYSVVVSTSIPKIVVFMAILLSGASGVLNYLFTSKFSLYLVSEGKSYVTTIVATTFSIATNILKILLLVLGGGILHLQVLYFLISIIQTVVIYVYMKKNYSWIDCRVQPNYDAIGQRHAVLVHKIAGLAFSSTDIMVLTFFCNLQVVSVYNMYAMLFGMMKSVAVSFTDGFLYLLGQNYLDKKKFNKLFDIYETCNMAITFAVFCIGYLLIIPFLRIYTAGIHDINYIDKKVALLFVVYYLLENGRKSSLTVASIAEKFEETKWRSVLEAVINLSVSLVCTKMYGIYGVLLGTIAGLLYRTTDAIIYAAKLLDKPSRITFGRWIRNALIFVVITILYRHINVELEGYLSIFLHGCIVALLIFTIFLTINMAAEPFVFRSLYNVIKDKILILKEKHNIHRSNS